LILGSNGPDFGPARLEKGAILTEKAVLIEAAEAAAKVVATEGRQRESSIAAAESRKLTLIWEWTQAGIAIIVVVTTMIATIISTFKDSKAETPGVLSSALFLVMGFYFGRNQHRTGRRDRASDDPNRDD